MSNGRSDTAFRVAGFYAASLAIGTFLLGAATFNVAGRTLRRDLEERMRIEMATLVRADRQEGRAALAADVAARDAAPGVNGGYLLTTANGRRVAGDLHAPATPLGWSEVHFREDDGSVDSGRAYAVALRDGAVVTIIEESSSLARIQRALLTIFAVGFGSVLALSVGGGTWLGSSILRRLGRLDEAARAIIEGDIQRRMPVSARGDEFDHLSATLNRMLDRMAELLDNLRHVSDDIAHDLRTPLSKLRARLELVPGAGDRETQDRLLTEAIERVDGLLALFATILRISELETHSLRRHFAPLRVDILIGDVVEAYAPAAEDAGHGLAWSADPLTIVADRDLVGQAIANLIDNALKHTPIDTKIHVSLDGAEGSEIRIVVADDGPGIPPSEHADVLRRFGRGSRGRQAPGHGLGLNLAAAVAAAHGGRLSLTNGPVWFEAALVLPRR